MHETDDISDTAPVSVNHRVLSCEGGESCWVAVFGPRIERIYLIPCHLVKLSPVFWAVPVDVEDFGGGSDRQVGDPSTTRSPIRPGF